MHLKDSLLSSITYISQKRADAFWLALSIGEKLMKILNSKKLKEKVMHLGNFLCRPFQGQ
jgi:hypothetical protein